MGIDSLKSGLPFSREARYMNTNGSEVYALLSNKYSSFSMYEGKQGENFVTYEASSKVCGTEKVKKFIAGGLDDNQLHSGFTLNFNGSGNAIRRKPRGSVGSKSHVASGASGSVDQTNQMTSDSKYGGVDMQSIPQLAKKKTRQRYNHKEKINSRKRCRFYEVTDVEKPLRFDADDIPSLPQHAKKKRKPLNIDHQHAKKKRYVGDASSRKGQSHGKKMKCLPVDNLDFAEEAQPVVEYIESSSGYSFDADVVDALMLLSIQPDAQCTGPSRSKENRLPIVYFRKRFRKKKDDGYLMSVADRLQIQDSEKEDVLIECRIDPKKLTWSIGSNGLLELNPALIPFQEFYTLLSLPVCPLLDFPFGSCTARSSQLVLFQQYGKIVSTWPEVYLEILLVDNGVGLRFLSLEGCLKQAVAFVFVVLSLFCDTNKPGTYFEGQIPVCSVRFKLSCVQDLRKEHAFTFYSFSKMKHSNWLYLDSVFQKHCLISKKLPLPECTLENIKALKGESSLHMNQLSWESSQGSRNFFLKDFIPIGLTKSGKENRRQAPKCTVKHGMLPFALPYSAAPLFFRSLHLKLLMRSSLACGRLRECTLACSMELPGNTSNSTTICCAVPMHCSEISLQVGDRCDTKGSQRNLELLACNSNVLITLGDRCWRKSGMRVVLEFPDQNEWSLAVKFSGRTEYSHKVHHVFQTGSANRYTRAMMWKGGKDWALEFPDRKQWMLFKEMHKECYKRNICAASEKNIPIPGARLVEKCEDNTYNPFTRSSGYLRNVENDIDMAMNPLNILYDMDSEDEQWILRNEKSLQTQMTSCRVITDDLFEKTMDVLEKFAYAQQRDHFTVAEIERIMAAVVPTEVIDSIYQHWQQKRKRIERPLIRHLQPPSWETYERKMQEWHQLMTQKSNTAACGGNMKAPPVEKPAMFAFCLKPHGLEVPRRVLKRRSKKKIHLAGHRHALIGDQDGIHTFEKRSNLFTFRDKNATFPDCSPRLFSLNNDASDFSIHPKLFKNKSKVVRSQLGMQALDEFTVREVSCEAKDACKIARIKRERAERLFFKAENAIHVAHSALMTANAVKSASCRSD
ncbi:hypothetical protein POM88_021623 [Heracleum sosnowskyi]|uniref:Enhancer of polycomb-like protein n=1 Tax=Heracleum sosnowskyi TaxID=360622 RepID=A0AAD8IEW6_9APIA|nr:hypothetical protein POM88_021623 [Heracleum sosnowskyi]